MKKRLSLLILIAVIMTLFLPSTALAVSELTVSDKITLAESVEYEGFGYKTALYGDTLAVLSLKISFVNINDSELTLKIYDLSSPNPQAPIETLFFKNIKGSEIGSCALAVSDDYLLVGISSYDDNGNYFDSGAMYIYNLNDPDIQGSAIFLTETNPDTGNHFGSSVAIYDDNIVVGAVGNNDYKAYIYSLSSFSHDDIVNSEISVEGPIWHFGQSVDIYKNKVVVSTDANQNSDTGTAYLYDLNAPDVDGSEIAIRAVGNDDTHDNDQFGTCAAISEDWLAVSSINDGTARTGSGSIYIYNLNAGDIAGSQEVIVPSGAQTKDDLGLNLSISGNLLVVTAPSILAGTARPGAAYVYDLSASDIAGSEIKLTPPSSDANETFGYSADIYGNQIVISNWRFDSSSGLPDTGAVYYTSLFKVSLNKDGGTGGEDHVYVGIGGVMPPDVAPTRPGYTFDGYYTEQNGGGTQYYNADMSSAKNWDIGTDTTLYAKWIANQYTVTFDKQYGSGGDDDVLVTFDSEMPSVSAPSKVAFSFAGYFSEPYGKGTKYYNADMSSARNWEIEGGMTLYAYWDSNPSGTYTVTFDSQGGSAVASQDVAYNGYASKPINPSRSGFSFGGWYTTSNSNDGTQWNFASSQISHDTILYAKWVAPNGGSVTDIEFDYAYKSVTPGTSANIASICPYTLYPAAALDKTVSWTSSNATVATISGDVLTAHAEGKTVITAEANDATNGTVKTKMIIEVMDATAVSLSASGKDIVGQVVSSGGTPLSNYCVTTYSDPLNTLTNPSGEFVFQGIPYTQHTLVVSNSSGTEIGRFSLNFNNTGKQSINVNNQTHTANVSYSAGTNYIDLKFQVNGASNDISLITSDISGTSTVPNPKTGAMTSNVPKGLIAFIPLLLILFYFKNWINREYFRVNMTKGGLLH